jgi:hypothetical protein
MSRSARRSNVYLSEEGDELLSAREAARSLGYHPVSFRRLVSRGTIRPHSRVGFASLYSRDDIERFRRSSPWAAKKQGGFHLPNPPEPLRSGEAEGMVIVKKGRRVEIFRRLRPFRWRSVPAIQAQVKRKFGTKPFRIVVGLPDGGRYEINFLPPGQRHHRPAWPQNAKKPRDLWLAG